MEIIRWCQKSVKYHLLRQSKTLTLMRLAIAENRIRINLASMMSALRRWSSKTELLFVLIINISIGIGWRPRISKRKRYLLEQWHTLEPKRINEVDLYRHLWLNLSTASYLWQERCNDHSSYSNPLIIRLISTVWEPHRLSVCQICFPRNRKQVWKEFIRQGKSTNHWFDSSVFLQVVWYFSSIWLKATLCRSISFAWARICQVNDSSFHVDL